METPLLTLSKPQIVPKGWGQEDIIVNNSEYCGKILRFKKGAAFSSHLHYSKRETFFCIRGKLIVRGVNPTNAEPYGFIIGVGDVVNVPRLAIHQLEAIEDSEIVEFSTRHEDSDSIRVAKGDSQR